MSTQNTANLPDVITAPTVSSTPVDEIPKAVYAARIITATDKISESSNLRMIQFDCEIVSPDRQPSQVNPGTECAVAGRKFNMYAIIDPSSKAFSGGHQLLGKLQLLTPEGNISVSNVINQARTGMLFFMVIIESEQEFQRLPKAPGQKEGAIMMYPGTKTPIVRGWRAKLPGESEVISRVAAPEGFVPAAF